MSRIPAFVILAILLAGCSSAAPSAEPIPTPRPSREPPPPTPSSSPEIPNLDSIEVTFSDAVGDLTDPDGQPVSEPNYVDVTSLQVRVTPLVFEANLTVAGVTPALNADIDFVSYVLVIDTNGDDDSEYWLALQNRSDTLFYPALDDWIVNYHYDEEEYPGAANIGGGVISWQVPMTALRDPRTIRLWVWTEKSFGDDVVANDYLPARFAWLTVR
jgi:hypothetical protein